MTSIQALLQEAALQLSLSSETPLLDAEILLTHVLGVSRSYLKAHAEENIHHHLIEKFNSYILRRKNREPIAYILGVKECWSRDWQVTSDTLIPRPETECLIEYVLSHFNHEKISVADLGTGSGVIALTLALERPEWDIIATDKSDKALMIAKSNAIKWHIHHVSFYQGDWCQALPVRDIDLIVSNPPYIAETEWNDYADGLLFEPLEALVSGKDGLDAIREISHNARHYLKPDGLLVIEHGFKQGPAVRHILAALDYRDVVTLCDWEHRERFTVAKRSSLM